MKVTYFLFLHQLVSFVHLVQTSEHPNLLEDNCKEQVILTHIY